MDIGARPQMTFESEVQRQHPRIRIPASVTLEGDRAGHSFALCDLSAGGFSFEGSRGAIRLGQQRGGVLHFNVKPLALSLPVRFVMRHHDPETGRIGCRFEGLGTAEASVLRQLIGSYLGGDLIVIGDMLATLSRDNLAQPRPQALADGSQAGAFTRLRAFVLTLLIFAVGLGAFSYAVFKLYTTVFVTVSSAAKVAAPSYTLAMPRDGTFFSLVPPDGIVKKGQAIGTFQSAMLDVMQEDPGSLHLTPAQMSELMGETLKGTISSPCDCQVHTQYAMDSQYVNRNQPLVELAPLDAKPYVLARFHFDVVDQLTPGREVTLRISGDGGPQIGTIRRLRLLPAPVNPAEAGGSSDLRGLNNNGVISDVLVEIDTARPLTPDLVERPVEVTLGDPRAAGFSFARLRALLPGARAS